jgi:hypothetical protein
MVEAVPANTKSHNKPVFTSLSSAQDDAIAPKGSATKGTATKDKATKDTPPGSKPNTRPGGSPDTTSEKFTHTPSPKTITPSTTYTNDQITITSAPNWGDQVIPVNHCNTIAPGGNIEWNPCMV